MIFLFTQFPASSPLMGGFGGNDDYLHSFMNGERNMTMMNMKVLLALSINVKVRALGEDCIPNVLVVSLLFATSSNWSLLRSV